jgi:uncharacterized repeat protein (TIGR03803 family)
MINLRLTRLGFVAALKAMVCLVWGEVPVQPLANLNPIHFFHGPLNGADVGGDPGFQPLGGLVQGRDGRLYGVTSRSGDDIDFSGGGIFQMTTNGELTTMAVFSYRPSEVELGSSLPSGTIIGSNPRAGLVEGPDGDFYGSTAGGIQILDPAHTGNEEDSFNMGALFKVAPAGMITMLACFTNHSHAVDRLAIGSDGNFYGVTARAVKGGGEETVFRLTPGGMITVLHTFMGASDGYDPGAGLIQGRSGWLFGTTAGGLGTIYQINTNGVLITLHSFAGGSEGSRPLARVVESPDGTFFGTTSSGGAGAGQGTVFQFKPGGELATLYTFTGGNDGANPGQLIWGNDGHLYGTTLAAGPLGAGTIFSITTNGVFTLLNWFESAADESRPSELIQGRDGSFYCTASGGGLFAGGAIYQLLPMNNALSIFMPPGNRSVLPGSTTYFNVSASGRFPLRYQWEKDKMPLRDDDRIYGSTKGTLVISNALPSDAGSYRVTVMNPFGTVTSVVAILTVVLPAAPMHVLYSFEAVLDSQSFLPMGGVTLDAEGNFWGTTSYDGGTVFRLAANGNFTTLHIFGTATNNEGDNRDGYAPIGQLVQGKDGAFYGTTQLGGQYDEGAVFKITSEGTFNTVVSFDGINGVYPMAGLTLGLDGNLYGTTVGGGASLAQSTNADFMGYGTVFKLTPSGRLTTLVSFNGANGAQPNGALTLAPDGSFYGTTLTGGASFRPKDDPVLNVVGSYGTVFKMTPNGVLTTLFSFAGTNGAGPVGSIALGTDGNLYGTLIAMVSANQRTNGAVYRLTPQGSLTLLHSFTGALDGGTPMGGLMLAKDGGFYGTTALGGKYGAGVVFRVTPAGAFTTVCAFTGGLDGRYPVSGLVQSPDGRLLGTTTIGGAKQGGIVYAMDLSQISPRLHVIGNRGQILLSWPASANNFTLERSVELGSHTQWFPLGIAPSQEGGQQLILLQPTTSQSFYRLRAP